MAEQLNHTNSEVVYMDFSTTSMKIAQYKAKVRGWLKIVWVRDWIESIPRLGLGNFDLAVSTGVLHHLKNPQKGLSTVSDVQLPHGGADIMVYATYGRTSLYWIQRLLRMLNDREHIIDEELKNAKHILQVLPDDHFFHLGEYSDHKTMGNVGVYDLLLHKRDISYTSTSFYQWAKQSGYSVIDATYPENAIRVSLKSIIDEKWLLDKLNRLSMPDRYEIGEIIDGQIKKHHSYVSKKHDSEASFENLDDTLIFVYGSPKRFRAVINEEMNYKQLRKETFVYSKLARTKYKGNKYEASDTITDALSEGSPSFPAMPGNLIWPASEFNMFILDNLTRKPIRPKVISSLITEFREKKQSNMTIEEGRSLFIKLYYYIKDSRMFFLKHKEIPTFPLTCCSFNLYYVYDTNT